MSCSQPIQKPLCSLILTTIELKMIRKLIVKLLCCGFFVAVIPSQTWAQTPTDPIQPGKVNLAYLEHLVKIQVDSVRQTKDLPPLVNDSILYLASRDHAHYLTTELEISHFQKSQSKKSPQNRVDFYGAKNYLAGENVLSYPLEDTYIATARRMVSGWVHSPGHYKNIITPDYQITGVAVLPHATDGNFIAVQVFAKVLWKYSFEANKQMFVYDTSTVKQIEPRQNLYVTAALKNEKLPWKLKPLLYDDPTKYAELPHDIRVSDENGLIQVRMRQPLSMKKLIHNRKDGLVAEIVAYEPYHCGNPAYYTALSRRNRNSSINGQLLKPVYKKELFKDLKIQKKAFEQEKREKLKAAKTKAQKDRIKREKWQPQAIDVIMGKVEDIIPVGYREINLLVFQKRRIVAPVFFSGICGDLSFRDTIPSVMEFDTPEFDFPAKKKKFSFSIPFARNDVQPEAKRMEAIRDTLLNYQIDSIDVLAYASVEGLNTKNTSLYQTRGNNIVTYLKQYIDTSTNISIRSGENWNLFYGQLKQSPEYVDWKGLSKEAIRQQFLDEKTRQQWEERLYLQRSASVIIWAHDFVRDTLRYVQQHYRLTDIKQATAKQAYYYQLWKQKKLPLDSLLAPVYPMRREYTQLITNQFRLNYQQNRATWNEAQIQMHWQKVKTLLGTPAVGVEMSYYATFFLLNHWHQINDSYKTDRLGKVLKNMANHNLYKGSLQQMRAIYALYMAPVSCEKEDYKQMHVYTEFVYEYYYQSYVMRLNAQRTLQLSNYFIDLGEQMYAYNMLDDYLKNSVFNVPIYAQFLKLAFVHPYYQIDEHYTQLLIDARQKLSQEQWCELFMGECGISFQMFDDENLRKFYCKECAERNNDKGTALTD